MAPARLANKETASSLRIAQARLAIALSAAEQLVWHQDADLRYTWIARAALGFTDEAVIGRTDAELLGDDAAAPLVDIKRRAIDTQTVQRGEFWLQNGGVRPACFDLTVIPEVDSSGTVSGVICTAIDITARREAEQALQVARQQLELAVQGADLGMWHLDLVTGEYQINERSAAMLGYRADELPSQLGAFERMLHPDDLGQVIRSRSAHLDGETAAYEVEYRLRHRDGHWVWVLSRGKVMVRDADGRPLQAAGTHLDITDRKHVQLEGPALLNRIELLIRGLSDVHRGSRNALPVPEVALTRRQTEVLARIAQGRTSAQIAKELFLSTDTVIGHRRDLMQRLGLRSVAELTRYAVEHGIDLPPPR